MPLDQLPGFVQPAAPYLPTDHYAQLAWSALGPGGESLGQSLAWLAGYTVVLPAIVLRASRREERRKFR
jgi:ABC-2 type transport system permease protein